MNHQLSSRHIAFPVVVLLAALALGACSAVADLGPMADTGESLMKAMKASDNAASYHLLGSALQKEIGGEQGWAAFAKPRVPTQWNFSNKSIENGQGKLEGTVSFANGQNLNVVLVLIKESSDWRIAGINFQ